MALVKFVSSCQSCQYCLKTLPKHAHAIYSFFSAVKLENFRIFFHIRQGDSNHNEYPQKRKIGIPQFFYIKVEYKGVYITQTRYPDESKMQSKLVG